MWSEMPFKRDIGTSTPRKCTEMKLKQEKPSTNQVEYHILLNQDKLLSWIRDKEMFLTACNPLAKGRLDIIHCFRKSAGNTEKMQFRLRFDG